MALTGHDIINFVYIFVLRYCNYFHYLNLNFSDFCFFLCCSIHNISEIHMLMSSMTHGPVDKSVSNPVSLPKELWVQYLTKAKVNK